MPRPVGGPAGHGIHAIHIGNRNVIAHGPGIAGRAIDIQRRSGLSRTVDREGRGHRARGMGIQRHGLHPVKARIAANRAFLEGPGERVRRLKQRPDGPGNHALADLGRHDGFPLPGIPSGVLKHASPAGIEIVDVGRVGANRAKRGRGVLVGKQGRAGIGLLRHLLLRRLEDVFLDVLFGALHFQSGFQGVVNELGRKHLIHADRAVPADNRGGIPCERILNLGTPGFFDPDVFPNGEVVVVFLLEIENVERNPQLIGH